LNETRRGSRLADWALALGLASAAAVTYSLSFHLDWSFDPLRYADLIQNGTAELLLRPQHALGTLLPFAAFQAARGLGYHGHAAPVLGGFSVTGAALAVGGIFLAAVRLGGSRLAAATAAALFGVAAAPWQAGGSGGVYGVAFAALACGWLLAARFARAPAAGSAVLLGVGAGFALGAHLENLAFVAASLVLVAALAPPSGRVRCLGAFALAVLGAAGVAFLLTSGTATEWSLAGMRTWALHPGIGSPSDQSAAIGWGVGGLFSSVLSGQPRLPWLPLGFDRPSGHLQFLIVIVLLVAAAICGVMLARRSRTDAVVAGALTVNAALAFLLASWYQALRADYWALGLLPIFVMAGAGAPTFQNRPWISRVTTVGVALAAIAGLLAWNASSMVLPDLRLSRDRGLAVNAIAARVPRKAYLVISTMLAARLSDDGYDAESGFGALMRVMHGGDRGSGVTGLIQEAATKPVYVSRAAFQYTNAQTGFLGVAGDNVWNALRQCCRLEKILRVQNIPGSETIYRLRPS
jgi:hypothetical protein